MDKYTIFREFADTWGLVAMAIFFLGAILFAFRPSSRAAHKDAANIVLRNGDTLEEALANHTKGESLPKEEART